MSNIRFTKEGFESLEKQYKELLAQRPLAVEDLKKARELGDLKENGYYKASRAKLSFIDSNLQRISAQIKQAYIVDKQNSTSVGIGSVVILSDGKQDLTYTIVGDLEADPGEGKISLLSPLGKSIEGKQVNDQIRFDSPRGEVTYTVIKIS